MKNVKKKKGGEVSSKQTAGWEEKKAPGTFSTASWCRAMEPRDKGCLIQGPTHTHIQQTQRRTRTRFDSRSRIVRPRNVPRVLFFPLTLSFSLFFFRYTPQRPMLHSTGCLPSKNTCFLQYYQSFFSQQFLFFYFLFPLFSKQRGNFPYSPKSRHMKIEEKLFERGKHYFFSVN